MVVDGSPGVTLPTLRRPWMPWALIAVGLLLFVGCALALIALLSSWKVANELGLPVLTIAGVICPPLSR